MNGLFDVVGFTGWLQTAVALAVFGFAPGCLLLLAFKHEKDVLALLREDVFESAGVAIVLSLVVLALASAALAFSVGVSLFSLFLLELLIIAGCWWNWKKSSG
ncbi:hypothetical protein AUJ14_02620 [Candidatus Micrarchaeota archaeon CG1_02_55_22]|nr:MAG: hypothetical protein AUJ14_02620 [Candidatus Micrarchaeota archaeon CG1_02_55_22]